MRRRLLSCVVLMLACSNPFAPAWVHEGRRPLTPVPASFAGMYAAVERCWSALEGRVVRGNYGVVRWWVADRIVERGGITRANATIRGDDITLARGYEDAPRTVMHEMSHHIQPKLGSLIHYQGAARAVCDDAPLG